VKTIDFTSGANPLGPSNKAKNAIRGHVRDISTFDDRYLSRLKTYIAKREGIDEDCVLFGCGSTAILGTILERTNPRKILIPHPASQRHISIVSKYNPEYLNIALKGDENFELNVEDFCNAMSGCDTAILPNPHDVTGSVISSDDMTAIVNETEKRGIYLILDESYAEYAGMRTIAVHIAKSSRAILLRTFSTFHALSGLRLGYVIGPPEVVKLIEPRLDPFLINSFAPRAAIASLKDKAYRRKSLLFIEDEKAYLHKKLSEIKGVKCRINPTNILVIQLQKDHLAIDSIFKRYHVFIQSFTDEHGNACMRFPVQARRQNAYFIRIIKRIMEA
jgi:threonine-phosphate decarboxylase